MTHQRATWMAGVVALLCVVAGCDEEKGFNERRALRERDVVTARNVVSRDLERGVRGVQRAAQLVARRFPDPDPERRERALRQLLVRTRQPPRAIEELLTSPVTFVAAVGTDGRVVARDAEPDPMRGYDLGAAAPIVRRALVEGVAGYALSELPGTAEGEQTSVTVVFAAPARREGQIVGAVAAGIPLWRLAQQLSRQLQLENAAALQRGELLWALVYKGDRLHHHAGFPPGLVELTPSASVRSQALAASPGGYTAEVQQYGRWYGYLVLPLPRIGEDAGMILYRSDAF